MASVGIIIRIQWHTTDLWARRNVSVYLDQPDGLARLEFPSRRYQELVRQGYKGPLCEEHLSQVLQFSEVVPSPSPHGQHKGVFPIDLVGCGMYLAKDEGRGNVIISIDDVEAARLPISSTVGGIAL